MLQFSPYFPPLLLMAVVAGASAYFGSRKQRREGSIWYVGAMSGLTAWSLFTGLLVVSEPAWLKLLFFGLYATSAVFLCLSWFLFGMAYTGYGDRITRPLVSVLMLIPTTLFLVAVTGQVDGLLLSDVAVVTENGTETLTYDLGLLYWFGCTASWVGTIAASVLFYRKAARSRNVYRKLSLVLAFGGGTMTVGNILSTVELTPFPHFMLVPFFFLFWGLLGITFFVSREFVRAFPVDRLLSLFSSRFDDVVHLARDFVVEEIDTGVVLMDTDGRIVDINGTARKMLATGDRVVGRSIVDVVDFDQFFERVDSVEGDDSGFDGGRDEFDMGELFQERRVQVWMETDIGERCYDINVSEITDDDGTPVGYTILTVDVTEQKEREQELKERKQDLEQQAQQLEHQNDRLDRFASTVSHDLRNPLSVIDSRAELARLGDSDDVDQHLEQIEENAARMADIIDDALTLARSGKAITETAELDLGTVASDAWDSVDTGAAELAVETSLRLEGDADRLLNVFENLYRNAIEHNDTDDLTIRVGTLEDGTGFFVEDTGSGIPEDRRDDVLEQGYTTNEDGTGFGLAIVRDIVKAHGWELAVAESPEGGARFEVECYQSPVDSDTATA